MNVAFWCGGVAAAEAQEGKYRSKRIMEGEGWWGERWG